MKLYFVLVLVTFVAENDARVNDFDKTHQDGVHLAASELARLIHLVSGYQFKESGLDEEQQDITEFEDERAEVLQPFDLDYYMVRNKEKLRVPKTVMALLQNYYDQKSTESPGVRLHFIRNPRVLEEYKKRIRKPAKLPKTSNENGDATGRFKDWLGVRRNAVFRFDSPPVIDHLRSKANDNNLMINEEFDVKEDYNDFDKVREHVIDDKVRDDVIDDKIRDDVIDNKVNDNNVDIFVDDDTQVIRKKGRGDDSLKQDNAWDVITKKYDWDDSKSNKDTEQRKFKKIKMDKDWTKKVTKPDFDDWANDRIDKPKKNKSKGERKKSKKKEYEPKERKDKIDWDVTYKTSRQTTRKRKSEPKRDWNKEYVPKVSYYDNPRPKKRDNYEKSGSGFFGRTPIPYVGRQGIYVD